MEKKLKKNLRITTRNNKNNKNKETKNKENQRKNHEYHNRKQIKKKERKKENFCKKNHVDISIKLTKIGTQVLVKFFQYVGRYE